MNADQTTLSDHTATDRIIYNFDRDYDKTEVQRATNAKSTSAFANINSDSFAIATNDNLIHIGETNPTIQGLAYQTISSHGAPTPPRLPQTIAALTETTSSIGNGESSPISQQYGVNNSLPLEGSNSSQHQIHIGSRMAPAVIRPSNCDKTLAPGTSSSIDGNGGVGARAQELITFTQLASPDSIVCDTSLGTTSKSKHDANKSHNHHRPHEFNLSSNLDQRSEQTDSEKSHEGEYNDDDEDDDYDAEDHLYDRYYYSGAGQGGDHTSNGRVYLDSEQSQSTASPSRCKLRPGQKSTYVGRLVTRLKFFGSGLANKFNTATGHSSSISSAAYTAYGNSQDLLPGATKYRLGRRKHSKQQAERSFRGSYRYSRIGIVMALIKKFFNFLIQRSTLALLGAFLIHVTLGTVYTLSNINSYLTSYMRKHGTPEATYGYSMWISASYSVGQGTSMVLGGYLERRFSARLSCVLGCLLHSMSIMSTSKTIDHGRLAVLLSYGFLPGFGCGLAYMTPMSNGFSWHPNRKGLVAGVILAGFGIGTFVFNMAQTAFVNPENLSPSKSDGYFTQDSVLQNVPHLFVFIGSLYAMMQFIGCCLLFKPPPPTALSSVVDPVCGKSSDELPILGSANDQMSLRKAIQTREFIVLFMVFGITNQGVLFVNSMLKEYGQIFIGNDMYLAWTGSMASIANSMGRLVWGLAIDRYTFTQCFTSITTIFGTLMFLMPFEFVLSSKLFYLLCTLGIFGSFSGWMSTYPVHLSRVFGLHNSGMVYGLIFVSQSIGGIFSALGAHYLIDNYSRFVPFFCVTFLELLGLAIYYLFYNK